MKYKRQTEGNDEQTRKNVKRDGDCKQQKRKKLPKTAEICGKTGEGRQEKRYSDTRNEGGRSSDKVSGRKFFGRGTKGKE